MAPVSLRFKRKLTTVFLFCEATDTFSKIKLRLADLVGAKSAEDIALYSADKATTYADEAMVSDFALTDESIVYVGLGGEAVQA